MLLSALIRQQSHESGRRDDARGLVAFQSEKWFVAGNQVLRVSGLRKRQ